MNILIVGSGGREHAIAWKVRQSKLCTKLFLAPGNGGTEAIADNLPVGAMDFEGIGRAVAENNVDFVIIGPDDPLAHGIVDYFHASEALNQIPVLGPTSQGARLESSKDFAKDFMKRHTIPTAASRTFQRSQEAEAYRYVNDHSLPLVIKADGLAAGKGVRVCYERSEAIGFLEEIWQNNKFGEAGDKIIVEEYLEGIELSIFILTDGKEYILLPEAKDYKRAGEGDTGNNTGGMGSVSPVPFADEEFMGKVRRRIIDPTIKGLQNDQIPYRGFIFIGLMNCKGDPYVIEYNARMGDPETQVVFPRIKDDIVPDLLAAAEGRLKAKMPGIDPRFALAVIAVSEGYPGSYKSGYSIKGIEDVPNGLVFHAGTKKAGSDTVTSGGRVLAVTALGDSLEEAREAAYENLSRISFENLRYRNDIGQDLLEIKAGTKS